MDYERGPSGIAGAVKLFLYKWKREKGKEKREKREGKREKGKEKNEDRVEGALGYFWSFA